MEETKNNAVKHELSMVEGETLKLTCVKNVPSFDNNAIEVVLTNECLKIVGENLEIDRLDLDEQTLSITGKVKSLVYGKCNDSKSILKRIFK